MSAVILQGPDVAVGRITPYQLFCTLSGHLQGMLLAVQSANTSQTGQAGPCKPEACIVLMLTFRHKVASTGLYDALILCLLRLLLRYHLLA